MAIGKKKLLSPKLSDVLRDIDNAREAINEKYTLNGGPDRLLAPLLSGDMAEAIRAITTASELPVRDGAVELTYDEKEKNLAGGYYKNGVNIKLGDYAIGYVWNKKGVGVNTQYVKINESFQIPDFGVSEVDGEELQGWSHMPDDEDPEYLTGDTVNHFQYEPRLEDNQYISYLYAVWKALRLGPIELEFEYANDGKLNGNNQEIVKMKVVGQSPSYPGLIKREYSIETNPAVREDISIGNDYYQHEITLTAAGVYSVTVTHTGKVGNPQVAVGVIKVKGSNGTMGDSGNMSINPGVGSWYDSGWVATNILKGSYISSARFEVKFNGHGNGIDALAIFVKKSNGQSYIIWDMDTQVNSQVDLSNLGTSNMNSGGTTSPIVLGSYTLNRKDLGSGQHYVPGPTANETLTFTKSDDVRQIRFFVFSSHDYADCMSNAVINYDMDYEFDMDLWESDQKNGI